MRFLQVEQARAEVAERAGAQPGDVHLGDAEPPADLGLRHAAVKVHQQALSRSITSSSLNFVNEHGAGIAFRRKRAAPSFVASRKDGCTLRSAARLRCFACDLRVHAHVVERARENRHGDRARTRAVGVRTAVVVALAAGDGADDQPDDE
jgi:hypothetical protein